jgi:hypothetical protein
MSHILVPWGATMNRLGISEPELYGTTTADLNSTQRCT